VRSYSPARSSLRSRSRQHQPNAGPLSVGPPWTAALLPPRPEVPWLAARWDAALGAVATFRARWEPAPIPGGTPSGRVLGSPGSESQSSERAEALWLIGDVWAGVATRLLRDHARGDDTLSPDQRALLCSPPSWLRRHLREIGAAGGFGGGVPTAALARLYGDVAEYRLRYVREVDTDDEARGLRSLLGERPDDPLGRRQWDVLADRAARVADARHVTRARAR